MTWNPHVTPEQQEIASCIASRPGCTSTVYGPQLPTSPDLPQILEVPWDVFGKPTYWELSHAEQQDAQEYFESTRVELELRSIGEKYKDDLVRGLSKLIPIKQLLCGKVVQLWQSTVQSTERYTIRETRVDTWVCLAPECSNVNLLAEDTCSCGGTIWAYRCAVCESYNPAVGVPCQICELMEHPLKLVRKVPRNLSYLVELPPSNSFNCDLSLKKINSLGYGVPDLDEFDVDLYSFAIDCARFEHLGQPTVRFLGRAVDLFGTNPSWFPLRPATLSW
jgi:hypothetical protein